MCMCDMSVHGVNVCFWVCTHAWVWARMNMDACSHEWVEKGERMWQADMWMMGKWGNLREVVSQQAQAEL